MDRVERDRRKALRAEWEAKREEGNHGDLEV